MRFFKITYYKNWISQQIGYKEGLSHFDITYSLELPSKRIYNARYREIERTGEYYMIQEICKNGKTFVFEIEKGKN